MARILRALSHIRRMNFCLLKHHRTAFCSTHSKLESIPQLAKLTDKGILRIRGKDSAKLLQGLITNDITTLKPDSSQSLFTMFLNSKGRILFDAFIYCIPGEADDYFLECDKMVVNDIIKHLKTYKLRAKVDIEDASKNVQVWVLFLDNSHNGIEMICNGNVLATKDPRVGQLCTRIIAPWNQSPVEYLKIGNHFVVESSIYKEHRYKWGIPEGMSEIPSMNSLPLEYNLALMNGVSFTKGCYIGQELTARTHHTGHIRKRIMPLQLIVKEKCSSYPTFAPGTSIKSASGKSAGVLTCMSGNCGLGLVRLKELNDSSTLGTTDINGKELQVIASRPNWWPGDL